MDRKNTPQLIAVIALILFLNIAYGFDILINRFKEVNSEAFTLNGPLLWVYALSRLLVASAFLWLFWYLLTKTSRGWFLPVLFIILGLLIVFSPVLYFTPLGSSFLALPSSLFFTAGALSVASGILAFILPKKLPQKETP
jgi:hypothetical protein